MWAAALLTDVGHGGEQLAGLARVDHHAPVHDFGDLRWLPAQPVERIRRQLLHLEGVSDHVGEDGAFTRDRRRAGGPAVLRYRDLVEDGPGMLGLTDLTDRKRGLLQPPQRRCDRWRAVQLARRRGQREMPQGTA